jgi:hypothetical protein
MGSFAADPSLGHGRGVNRILRYIKETKAMRLSLGNQKERTGGENKFTVHIDGDFAGDLEGMRSTSRKVIVDRYWFTIAWRSAKQPITAKSTADA